MKECVHTQSQYVWQFENCHDTIVAKIKKKWNLMLYPKLNIYLYQIIHQKEKNIHSGTDIL